MKFCIPNDIQKRKGEMVKDNKSKQFVVKLYNEF